MATEQQIYNENRTTYDNLAVCKELEPNFTNVFKKLQNEDAFLDENGQIVWKICDRVLAGFFTVPLFWSSEALRLEIEPSKPFESAVLIKNPGNMNKNPSQDAWSGAVNGLVMIEDILWCAAIQPGTRFMKLVRRVTDLTGAGRDFQHELATQFTNLLEQNKSPIASWNPILSTTRPRHAQTFQEVLLQTLGTSE